MYIKVRGRTVCNCTRSQSYIESLIGIIYSRHRVWMVPLWVWYLLRSTSWFKEATPGSWSRT